MTSEGTGGGWLWILAAAGAVSFLGWKTVPAYLENGDVGDAVFDTLLGASTRSDEELRQELKRKLLGIGVHLEPGEGGHRFVSVVGLLVDDEQIVVKRDRPNNAIRMELTYERGVNLAPLPKTFMLHFHDVKSAQISHY